MTIAAATSPSPAADDPASRELNSLLSLDIDVPEFGEQPLATSSVGEGRASDAASNYSTPRATERDFMATTDRENISDLRLIGYIYLTLPSEDVVG